MGVVPGCECGLCKAAAGPLLIVDEISEVPSFKEVLADEVAKKVASINAQVMAAVLAPTHVNNNDAFASHTEVDPPLCPGCGYPMDQTGYPQALKWHCHHGCYYCENDPSCGYQDQKTYCKTCMSCAHHCTHNETHDCPDCLGTFSNDEWCSEYEKCVYCDGCHEDDYEDDDIEYTPSNTKTGVSTKPGWIERGINVEIEVPSSDYTQFWDFKADKTDLVQEMASFYVKEFIAANGQLLGVSRELFSEEIASLVDAAKGMLDEQVAKLDPIMQSYIDMAVGGEVRYHKAMSKAGLGKNTYGRESAWVNWYYIRKKVGPDALLDMAKLAREVKGGGILGEAWAVPAEILHARITGKIDARTFVDRAFSLQHNGGCLFNKVLWANLNRPGWDLQAIQFVIGPSHDANPITWGPLLAAADAETVDLFNRYWTEANKVRSRVGLPVEVRPSWRDGLVINGTRNNPYIGYTNELIETKLGQLFRWMRTDRLVDPEFTVEQTLDPEIKAEIDAMLDPPELANLPEKWKYLCGCSDCQLVERFRNELYVKRNELRVKHRADDGPKLTSLRDLAATRNPTKAYMDEVYSRSMNKVIAVQETSKCPNAATKKKVSTKAKTGLSEVITDDMAVKWKPGGPGGGGQYVYVPTNVTYTTTNPWS